MAEQPLNAPVPNLPLLRKVLDHIDAHPEEWHQSLWGMETSNACGTALCIAGHAMVMSGYATSERTGVPGRPLEFFTPDGRCVEYTEAEHGQRLLGLTRAEAEYLFRGGNTRQVVQRYAEAIAARAGERL